tara:strand:- start:13818 stop:15764 length:1947 start_codon:yes stop_codon:yes gene_type:complete
LDKAKVNKKPYAIEQALIAIKRYQSADHTLSGEGEASAGYVQWLKKSLPRLAIGLQRAGSTVGSADLLRHVKNGRPHIESLLIKMKPKQIKNKQKSLTYDTVVKALPLENNDSDPIKAIKANDAAKISGLINQGADIHANNDDSLRWAAENGHEAVVQMLIDNGADIHANNDMALRLAAQNGHEAVVQILIDNGADIHARDDWSLRGAGENGHAAVVQILIDNGADIHAIDDDSLRRAAQNGHYPMLERLVQKDAVLFSQYLSQDPTYKKYQSWRRLHNNFDVPKALLDKNPYDFKLKTYLAVEDMLKKEGYSGAASCKYAYDISTLFRTEDRVLQYLEKWGEAGKQPLHDCAHFIAIPAAGQIDYKAWGDATLQQGPKIARLVKFADRVAQPAKSADGESWSLSKTTEQVAKFYYKGATKSPELAALCFRFNWDDADFNTAHKQIEKYQKLFAAHGMRKTEQKIPEIGIDGAKFKKPDYHFYKLPDGDLRGLLLGEFTNCCQHLANQGADCAKHGFLSENGGFYVVAHKKTDQIVGQSWAWRGKKDELVFDSLESLSGHFNAQNWESIMHEFVAQTTEVHKGNISAVHIGAGGNTPELKFNQASLAKPLDYKGYRDSEQKQYLVSSMGHFTKNVVVPQGLTKLKNVL